MYDDEQVEGQEEIEETEAHASEESSAADEPETEAHGFGSEDAGEGDSPSRI